MKNCFSLFVFLLFIIQSSVSFSYDNKLYLEHDGIKGYWFDESTADLILKDLSELSVLKDKTIPAFEEKISLQELSIKKYKIEMEFSDQIISRYKETLKKSEENYNSLEEKYQKALDRNDKWYKSPSFLFIFGVVSGGLLAVGISFGLKG